MTLSTGFDLPRAQVPLFLVNAALMGAIWGALRLVSDSIVVSSVSHGLWNGLAYALFGYGTVLVYARRQFSDDAPTAPVQVVIAP